MTSSNLYEEEPSNTLHASIVAELGHNLLEEAQQHQKKIKILEENDREKDREIKVLKETVRDLKTHKTRLEQQLDEASNANYSVVKEIEHTKKQLKLITSSDKSYSILAEHYRTAILEVESLKDEIEKRQIKEIQLKKEIAKLERSHRSAETQEATGTAAEQNPKSALVRRASTGNVELIRLQTQLQEAEIAIETKQDHVDELEAQNRKLNEMVRSLVKRTNELEGEKEERLKVEKKLKEQEEMQDDQFSRPTTRGRSSSIASEIETQIHRKYEHQFSKSLAVLPIPKVIEVEEKVEPKVQSNPNEDFFYMTVQAMKVQFAISNKLPYNAERISEKIFLIKHNTMFEQVSREKVPFHEWHRWIKKELGKKVTEMIKIENELHPHLNTPKSPPSDKKVEVEPSKNNLSLCCSNFQPQFWKKNICKECLHTKMDHHQQTMKLKLSSSSP